MNWNIAIVLALAISMVQPALAIPNVQPALANCTENPIIFVHGGAGSGAQFETQAMRFTSNGYPAECIMTFEYDSSAYSVNPAYQTQTLANLSQLVNVTSSVNKVVLIGHSLGTRVVYNYTLLYPDYVDKVAKIILIDGIANVPAPSVPTMAIFGRPTDLRPPGAQVFNAENVYFQNQTHVEVATSPESFAKMYKFITGREPFTTYILPEKEITLAGKLVYFPSNIGLETGTLKIYEINENGFRISETPVATFEITDGNWSFGNAKPGVRYEFEFVRANNKTMHFYREPFIRSDYWIRFLVSPPGGLADQAHYSPDQTNLLIIRYKEILTGYDPDYVKAVDNLTIDGVAICDPRICNVSKPLNGPTGIWIFDNNTDQVSNLYPPIPYFHAQAFQTGIDYFIQASDPPAASINVTIFNRGGGVQTIKVPNWNSNDHRVVVQFNEFVQSYWLIPGESEVIVPYYANPFIINIDGMANFNSISVDDPSDGINWTKVDLPSDCRNGVGNGTFIMVRKGSENKVLIYLEGGGACSSYDSCGGPSSTVTTLEPEFDTGLRPLKTTYVRGIFDVKNPLNPFRNWTMVFVPYSTGDIHMGNRVVKYYNVSNPAQNKTIYHVGYVNAIVAMRWINASGIDFENVVVTGTSAGGFGTILHFYRASEIFKKGIIAINDAGPGTAPNATSPLGIAATTMRWGTEQNYPPESLPYFANTDTLRFLNWALNGSAGGCGNCTYALFEDQWDFVIGPYFQRYSFTDYQARLLSLIANIKANFSNRFCAYLPLSTYHTVLAGGYNYPSGDRFYALNIDGYYVRQWISDVLNGTCVDAKDSGLRDLQVEILSYSSTAFVGNAYNITVKVSNVGSNATPDPFFVLLTSGTTTLGYKVYQLPANSNVTFNFTWTPTAAGTYQLNVTVDGLPVPTLATLLPFGSVVELGNPASEANNTKTIVVTVSTPPTPTPPPIVGGGAGGGGAIPGVPVYITAYETTRANEETELTLPQSAFWETNVVALIIMTSEDNNVRFRIEKLKELPETPKPEGMLALILSIEPTMSKPTALSGKIKFGIEIDEIKAKGFDPSLVVVILMKWDGSKWIELPTSFVGSDGKYNYYEAETPSFSYFVAVLKPAEKPTPTPTATPTPTPTPTATPMPTPAEKPFIPGFEAVFAVAGLLAVAYLLRRKN